MLLAPGHSIPIVQVQKSVKCDREDSDHGQRLYLESNAHLLVLRRDSWLFVFCECVRIEMHDREVIIRGSKWHPRLLLSRCHLVKV